MTSTSPRTLPERHPFSAVARLATSRIPDPRSLARFPPPAASTLRTRPASAPFAPVKASSRGQCRQQDIQRATQRSNSRSRFFVSSWKVRHRLRLCVLEKIHVLLVHKGEVVLQLEKELQPGPLVIVVLDRLCSKLQDFCNV